jgi:hypothetical protein
VIGVPIATRTRWLTAAVLAAIVVGFGCASQSANQGSATQAIQAAQEIPEDQLLDVAVQVFDPGLPPQGQPVPEDVFPELRRGESRYQAIRLKETMEISGQWGAVRVLPGDQGFNDLRVTGTIVLSTGSKLTLDLRAVDASGREWLDHRYRGEADELVYTGTGMQHHDPFQAVYNEISNDLLDVRLKMSAGELHEIRQISRLRFAADLAPVPFEEYLTTNKKGRIRAKRLPARDDPMMARADNIRASENLFVDTLDQNYASFYARMEEPYSSWRKYTYEEEKAYKALKRKALTQKILGGLAILGAVLADPGSPAAAIIRDAAVIGGMAAIHAGIATSKEAKIHAEALRELAASVETELQPIVVEVHGRTLRLTGSAETQYQEWRRMMQEIWATETGLPVDPNRPGATSRPDSAVKDGKDGRPEDR